MCFSVFFEIKNGIILYYILVSCTLAVIVFFVSLKREWLNSALH